MTRDAMVALDLPRDPTLRVSLPEAAADDAEANALTPEQLVAFLEAMRGAYPQHYALVATLAYTGLRFCHASALRWEDWDEQAGVLRVVRKHFRGKVGAVSRKKRAPKEYPVEPELAQVLRDHRARLLGAQAQATERGGGEGGEAGWMFPSAEGTLRTPNSLDRAWARCLKQAGIAKRFTVHGLRYTFTDLVRRANVDAVVRRALTGHVTEQMQRHYSGREAGGDRRGAAAGPGGAKSGGGCWSCAAWWDQRWDHGGPTRGAELTPCRTQVSRRETRSTNAARWSHLNPSHAVFGPAQVGPAVGPRVENRR
jgi:integrase